MCVSVVGGLGVVIVHDDRRLVTGTLGGISVRVCGESVVI